LVASALLGVYRVGSIYASVQAALQRALHDHGLRYKGELVGHMHEHLDLDKDGSLTYAEFRAILLLCPSNNMEELFDSWFVRGRTSMVVA
jgi:hypothetical protein